MNKKDLKELLDRLYEKYKNKYSSNDPIWILHEFQDKKDIEIIGLITSCYAYGRVDQINQFINKFLKNIGFKVYEFTANFSQEKDKKFLKNLYYRFNKEEDLSILLLNIKNSIVQHGSLHDMFINNYNHSHENILPALTHFTSELNKIANKNTLYKYLIPSPGNNSTCKRLNMYLRWMIRKDKIDLGIWSGRIHKSKLIMPVDTHIYRIARKLKMVKRISCDMKFAIALTKVLKKFDKEDPVKFDFAMCHIGIDKISHNYIENL